MGRQRKRARERQRQRRRQPVASGAPNWPLILGGAVLVLAVVAGAIALATTRGGSSPTAVPGTPTPAPTAAASPNPSTSLAKRIDGIPCQAEMLSFHEHAHLAVLDAGQDVPIPAYIGITQDCLYWLHTHDESGIIHIEAPHKVSLTLGNFFDIWGQPLSRKQVVGASVGRGQSMRIYVNLKPYHGDPRKIVLGYHTLITVEVGPPFKPPEGYNFDGL